MRVYDKSLCYIAMMTRWEIARVMSVAAPDHRILRGHAAALGALGQRCLAHRSILLTGRSIQKTVTKRLHRTRLCIMNRPTLITRAGNVEMDFHSPRGMVLDNVLSSVLSDKNDTEAQLLRSQLSGAATSRCPPSRRDSTTRAAPSASRTAFAPTQPRCSACSYMRPSSLHSFMTVIILSAAYRAVPGRLRANSCTSPMSISMWAGRWASPSRGREMAIEGRERAKRMNCLICSALDTLLASTSTLPIVIGKNAMRRSSFIHNAARRSSASWMNSFGADRVIVNGFPCTWV
ncbi:hypothetical protein FA95DRAFT_1287352 [Auriscalpium vulgare]|uniref:Uncharacterized protein n=1 Tax=Auriscalpium vulgare TaxID=40419 RepID=A0ACB8RU28_9AGAM|nr:hypothetical protein FA95DRAFT_1287352 [Auriscalpium vulgare]